MLATVESVLEANGFAFTRDDANPGLLSFGVKGDVGQWGCLVAVREEQDQLVIYSVLDARVPPEHRSAMAEYMTRRNYRMVVGNLEMDYDDGEVRLRVGIDVEGAGLSAELANQMFRVSFAVFDDLLPELEEVAAHGRVGGAGGDWG